MSIFDSGEHCYMALVTFERATDHLGILPKHVTGGCGWIGVRVSTESEVLPAVDHDLAEIGLRLLQIDRIIEVYSLEGVAAHDGHLAENIASWADGRLTAWGTIRTYIGDGEA